MSAYRVLSPILHDGQLYQPNSVLDVELSEGQADQLVAAGVLQAIDGVVDAPAAAPAETTTAAAPASAEPALAETLLAAEPVSAPQAEPEPAAAEPAPEQETEPEA